VGAAHGQACATGVDALHREAASTLHLTLILALAAMRYCAPALLPCLSGGCVMSLLPSMVNLHKEPLK